MKFPLVYESDNIGDSLSWRSWCYFEAQVWKRIVALSLLSFLSFFWRGFLLLLFYLAPLYIFLGLLLFWPFLTRDNVLIMMIITLLFTYNSILQLDTRTIYDSIWMPPEVYRDVQWIKSDMYEKLCMVALPQIRCQLHDHAWQYDNMKRVIWTERWKVAWQYISEWLWKCQDR